MFPGDVFPRLGNISVGICVSWVGEHKSLGICISSAGEHISLGYVFPW